MPPQQWVIKIGADRGLSPWSRQKPSSPERRSKLETETSIISTMSCFTIELDLIEKFVAGPTSWLGRESGIVEPAAGYAGAGVEILRIRNDEVGALVAPCANVLQFLI